LFCAAATGVANRWRRHSAARGDIENGINECQGDLFAGRTSTATIPVNLLRLWFASTSGWLRHITAFSEATCPPHAPQNRSGQRPKDQGRNGLRLPHRRRGDARGHTAAEDLVEIFGLARAG
jgi:hypothetical protein